MKHVSSLIIILLGLFVLGCSKKENITPSSSRYNIVGKWKINNVQTKKSHDYYQQKDINKEITLPSIEKWDYFVITKNHALLITYSDEVINFGNYSFIDDQITLLDSQTNNNQILLLLNLTTSSQAIITYTLQEIISEDDTLTQPHNTRLACYKL